MKDLRINYTKGQLLEQEMPEDPFQLFDSWFKEAMDAKEIVEPNAMTLSTSKKDGSPDSRIVLLKDVRNDEFVFYTNYTSHKGSQLSANSACVLLFPWINLERQVIIRGVANKVPESESDEYFASRPKTSKIGAWVSDQSTPVPDREELENKLSSLQEKYKDSDPERPPHWGGFAITPLEIEFWQGRANRLHDRIVYTKIADYTWTKTRLQP